MKISDNTNNIKNAEEISTQLDSQLYYERKNVHKIWMVKTTPKINIYKLESGSHMVKFMVHFGKLQAVRQ